MTLDEALHNPPPAKLQVQNVSKTYHGARQTVEALQDINLQVAEGEFVCLLGASGCGKSTLLNLIAGLEAPTSGSIHADGQPVTGPGRQRMVMFQEHALFPWLDVINNVLFGLNLKPGLTDADRKQLAMYYLKLVGLENFAHASIHELSGGMKQRVALARALAPNPRVLLMDEPFAALDEITRLRLNRDLLALQGELGMTVLFVTHSVYESAFLSSRICVFSERPGRIVTQIDVEAPTPRNESYRLSSAYLETCRAASQALEDAMSQESAA